MANVKEVLVTLRDNFVGTENVTDEEIGMFDTALSKTLLALLDPTPEQPKKRTYTRKPKTE